MAHLIDKDALVAEIKRRRDAALMRQQNLESIGQESVINEIVANELNRIISFINTLEVKDLQEEPVSEDIQKIGSLKSLEYYPEKKTTNKTSKGVFDANMPRRKAYLRGFKDGAHAHKELIANKPVSEELEEAAVSYAATGEILDNGKEMIDFQKEKSFKAGAEWQKEKDQKK